MSQPYEALEAAWHDAFWSDDGHGEKVGELPLIRKFLASHPGPTLEIACGSGRLLAPLIESGHDAYGLELSPDMIALAAHHFPDRDRPPIHQGDMATWTPPARFASLLVPAFSLQLVPDAMPVLSRWRDWLRPAGGLYLTLMVPFAEIEEEYPEDEWYEDRKLRLPDGRRGYLETRHSVDVSTQTVHRQHRYSIDGTLLQESTQTLHWHQPREVAQMLASCGFKVRRAYLDFDPSQTCDLSRQLESTESEGIFTIEARRLD